MAGGFSYPLSQLNRATQAHRQPGSTLKPLTYLAALAKGLQPNTLVWDAPVTLPPVGGRSSRPQDYWSPQQLRPRRVGPRDPAARARELEEPRHRAPPRRRHQPRPGAEPVARLRARHRGAALPRMRALLPVRARRPAGAAPRSCRLLRRGRERGRAPDPIRARGRRGERAGDLRPHGRSRRSRSARPTASPSTSSRPCSRASSSAAPRPRCAATRPMSAARPAPPTDEADAWFVGFTNDVTIAVWVGYDNADGKRRTLGRGPDRGQGGDPDLRADPAGGLGLGRAEGRAGAALGGGKPPARRPADRPAQRRPPDRPQPHRLRRAFPPRPARPPRRDPVPPRAGRAGLCLALSGLRLRRRRRQRRRLGRRASGPRRLRAGAVVARRSRHAGQQQPGWRQPTTPPWWDDEDPRQRRSRRVDPDYPWRNQIY